MKKLFAAIIIAMFAITLSACGNGDNPDDPDVIVDCTENPDDPSCELECDLGYEEVDGACVLIDPRSAEEIAADLVEDNFDGTMKHAEMMMENMDFSDAMTLITEFNVDVTDGEGVNHILNYTMKDEVSYGEYALTKRTIMGEVDEEEFEFILYIEETATGFIVYYDTTFLRTMIDTEGENPELQEVLDTLDANGTWFMFKFDDSLTNLVEFEVLREMLIAAMYQELGDDFLSMMEQGINDMLEVDLATYGFMFEDFVELIFEEDYEAAELMLDNVNSDQLILDLDQLHIVPEIIYHLEMYELDMLAIDPTWDHAAETQYLLDNGTQAWLEQLTEREIENILAVHDPFLGGAYAAYLEDDLDHFIVMEFLNDPQVQMDLGEIPGLDVPEFVYTMDNLDYDALALELEVVDFEALFNAVYEGYEAYDLYVIELALTAPELASILEHFGGVDGLVDSVQEYMVYVDDIELGIMNLAMFEEYGTLDYYLGIDLLDIELDITSTFDIITTATVDTSASSQLFADVLNDVYWYLEGFEVLVDMPYVDVFNCPVDLPIGETCDTFTEYPEILEALGALGEIVLTVEYDPLNMDETVIHVQFSDFIQDLIIEVDETDMTVVNDFSVTITMMTSADVDVPTEDITDVNQKIEDFAKFSLVMEARNILNNIDDYYNFGPMPRPTVPSNIPVLQLQDYIGVSGAFDNELSYFRVDGEDITLQLYWLDGTPVFTEALSMTDLNTQFGSGTGAPERADFLYWMDMINPQNFNMTKLFLVYMWERYEEGYYMPY